MASGPAVGRGVWALGALVLGLGGWYVLLIAPGAWAAYLLIGVGIGIACSVGGSLAHDALAGPRERL